MSFEIETRNLVEDYISWRLAKSGYKNWYSGVDINLIQNDSENPFKLMRELAMKFELKYNQVYGLNLCSKFNITQTNYKEIFYNVTMELFQSRDKNTIDINWTRIIALFAFFGCLAVYCHEQDMLNLVQEVIEWLYGYLTRPSFSTWIKSRGSWDGFSEYFNENNQKNSTMHNSQFEFTLFDRAESNTDKFSSISNSKNQNYPNISPFSSDNIFYKLNLCFGFLIGSLGIFTIGLMYIKNINKLIHRS